MVRSRSRSPRRGGGISALKEKRRSRSRDRDRERDRERRRHHRSRSRSPRRRSRSPRRRRSPDYKRRSTSKDNDVVFTGTSQVSPSHVPTKTVKPSKAAKAKSSVSGDDQVLEIPDAAMEGKTEEEVEMMKLMGFGGFETTKGKQVKGADVSATNVIQKRKYRQYMNRRGGFNRPLDFVA